MWNRGMITFFSRHHFRNSSTLDTGVFGYIGVINIRNIFLKYVTFRLKHPEYRQQLGQYRCGGNGSGEEYV
jgi:hypothetical protein